MAPKLKRPSGSKSSAPKRVKKAPATQLGQGLQRQELKAFDTALSFAFDATGEVPATGQLCFVQTGDTLNNRDGAVIMVKSLAIRARWVHQPMAAATSAGTSTSTLCLTNKQTVQPQA